MIIFDSWPLPVATVATNTTKILRNSQYYGSIFPLDTMLAKKQIAQCKDVMRTVVLDNTIIHGKAYAY